MLFERNESKVANLLATIDELVDHDKIEVLVECIAELEKEHVKLRKQFEDHEELDYVSAHSTPMTKKQHEQELLLQEAILYDQGSGEK
jgi:hypothetical protein